jgi:hypothetical protein
MGRHINTYPIDNMVENADYLLGSDRLTGKTFSYPISKIIELIGVNVGSVTGIKVHRVDEDGIRDWMTIVNESTSPITFFSGVVGFFDVYNVYDDFKESHLLIKNQTTPLEFGLGFAPLTQDMLLPIRVMTDNSIPTEGKTEIGSTGVSVFSRNDTDDYKMYFKGLLAGYNIEINDQGDDIVIRYIGDVGESNNIINSEENISNIRFADGKTGVDLKVKSLLVTGAPVIDNGGYYEVVIWKKVYRANSFVLTNSDNHTTFWIDSSGSIDVTIPTGIDLGFEVAFIKSGAGNVRFITTAGVTLISIGNTLATLGGTAWIENAPLEPKRFALLGDLTTT